MTEEIIIDGVNVSGCNAYKEGHCLDKTAILLCDTNKCSNYNDCYYKQLKRLEQENKELKEKKDKYYQQALDDEILMNELSLEVDLRKKESGFYLEKLSKYRSALEEIKKKCNWVEECSVTNDNLWEYDEILEIINEVLK